MHRKKIVPIALILAAGWLALAAQGREFSGAHAMDYARKAVSFGPRPPGSAALRNLRAYIVSQLKLVRGCEVIPDSFTGNTPIGSVPMVNIIARFPGKSGRAVVLTGHYDTKKMAGMRFVGADDGGSSTAFLLEMAETLQGMPHNDDIYLVWFDGEEAFGQWSDSDSLYGSRHLAARWAADGTLGRIKALINVDMIGGKDLHVMNEENSSPALRKLIWNTAERSGYGKYFDTAEGATDDDHMPFVKLGVNAVDLIDFDTSKKTYWHTPEDTMDKLAVHSFDVLGAVLTEVLKQL
ncbi:MAG TPA: M28 family peptidase [Bryobacteraceae bacterium]|nr:M28 family peptidase [Bryobacteraceae bacterium]